MADLSQPGLPSRVQQRDGQVVPFDPGRISEDLFALTEELGRPDAFLAHELTGTVLHFLADAIIDQEAGAVFSQTIAEHIHKVLHELGQLELASAYLGKHITGEQNEPTGAEQVIPFEHTGTGFKPDFSEQHQNYLRNAERAFATERVYARDLLAAQREGWLSLAGLAHPTRLAASVLDWPRADKTTLACALAEESLQTGGLIAIDSPDWLMDNIATAQQSAPFLAELDTALAALSLHAVVNLNIAEPPPWSDLLQGTPLFPATRTHEPHHFAMEFARLWGQMQSGRVRMDWHVSERDFTDEAARKRLLHVADLACSRRDISFVFDRPRRPIALAEGLDRKHTAVLQTVALHLARLTPEALQQMPAHFSHHRTDPASALATVASMAVHAGVQKRRFLRSLADTRLGRGFLLDRARLTVIPLSLQALTAGDVGSAPGSAFVKQLVQELNRAGRTNNLDVVLDSPGWLHRDDATETFLAAPHLAGLTAAHPQMAPAEQLRTASNWHRIAGAGTATLLSSVQTSEQLVETLQEACRKTELNRLRFHFSCD